MKKRNIQVSPKTAAIAILFVLVVVQYIWWKGLVAKPKPGPPGQMSGGGGGGAGPPILYGRKDVLVNTFTGATEPGDADGTSIETRFDSPVGIARDSQGNLYVADSRNHRIRKVSPTGRTTTLAGSGQGFAEGEALKAKFYLPSGIAIAPDGVIYVADTGNHRIRRIQNGQVTTLAGGEAGFAEGQGRAVKFNTPTSLVLAEGAIPKLYVADTLNRRIRILDTAGKTLGGWAVPTPPTSLLAGQGSPTALPQTGVFLQGGKTLANIPMALNPPELKQSDFILKHPTILCAVRRGWFVADARSAGVFHLRDGVAELLAGRCEPAKPLYNWRDGTGDSALFGEVGGIVWDGKDRLYVSDTSNNMIRVVVLPPDVVE